MEPQGWQESASGYDQRATPGAWAMGYAEEMGEEGMNISIHDMPDGQIPGLANLEDSVSLYNVIRDKAASIEISVCFSGVRTRVAVDDDSAIKIMAIIEKQLQREISRARKEVAVELRDVLKQIESDNFLG